MKRIVFIFLLTLVSILPLRASTVVGDNMGNHKQTKDLNSNGHDILNPGLVDGVDIPVLESSVLTNTNNIEEIRISTGWVPTATSDLDMAEHSIYGGGHSEWGCISSSQCYRLFSDGTNPVMRWYRSDIEDANLILSAAEFTMGAVTDKRVVLKQNNINILEIEADDSVQFNMRNGTCTWQGNTSPGTAFSTMTATGFIHKGNIRGAYLYGDGQYITNLSTGGGGGGGNLSDSDFIPVDRFWTKGLTSTATITDIDRGLTIPLFNNVTTTITIARTIAFNDDINNRDNIAQSVIVISSHCDTSKAIQFTVPLVSSGTSDGSVWISIIASTSPIVTSSYFRIGESTATVVSTANGFTPVFNAKMSWIPDNNSINVDVPIRIFLVRNSDDTTKQRIYVYEGVTYSWIKK